MQWGSTTRTVADTIAKLGACTTRHGYHQFCGEIPSVLWRETKCTLGIIFTVLVVFLHCTEYPPSDWYPFSSLMASPIVLMVPSNVLMASPTVLNILHSTDWYPFSALLASPTVLMVSYTILMASPTVLNILHNTD